MFLKSGLPTFNWSLGLGIDIIGQYSYYILGDPFAYVSLLFPMDKLELAYNILVIARIYFIGIAFMAYCKYNEKSTFNTVLGAIIYTFSGFVLYAGVRHPFFMNALIIFPIMLLAIDKLYKEDKVKLLVIIVAISAIMNYYFLYMMSILMFIYGLAKFFCQYKENGYKFLFKKLGKAILAYIIGGLIAGILLAPTIYAYFNSNRFGNAETTMYGFKYYKTLFLGLTSNNSLYWSRICLPTIILLMIPIMLKNSKTNKENKTIKTCIVLETIMLLFNYFGSFMNGFSFQSNRWVFGYTFLLAYMVVLNFKRNLKYSKTDILNMIAMLTLYFFGLFVCAAGQVDVKASVICCLFAVCSIIVIIINKKVNKPKISRYIILGVVVVNIIYYGLNLFETSGKDYISEFINQNEVMQNYNNYGSKIENYDKAIYKIKEKDNGFYRISNNLYSNTNISLIHHYNALNAYLSIGNKYIGKLSKQINNRVYNSDTNPLRELDGRTKITTLLANKYYIVANGKERYVPYGYKKIEEIDNTAKVYENTNALSIGVFYDNYITEKEYSSLSYVEREQALLDSALVHGELKGVEHNDNKIKEIQDKTSKRVKYEIVDKDKILSNTKDKKTKIDVKKENQSIELSFEKTKKCELYIEIRNFRAKSKNKYNIEFKYNDIVKTKNVRDAVDDPYYVKNDHILINLGYRKKHAGKIKIAFQEIGEYTCDEIRIIAVPMKAYTDSVKKLKKTEFKLTEYKQNILKGNIETTKNGVLQISTPYTIGWKAYVDGKEQKVINVNTGFIGIQLSSGSHDVLLKYETPYLDVGVILTCVGIIGFIVIAIYEKRKIINNLNKIF